MYPALHNVFVMEAEEIFPAQRFGIDVIGEDKIKIMNRKVEGRVRVTATSVILLSKTSTLNEL